MTTGVATRCRLVSLPRVSEQRGSLCVAEVSSQVPFAIARVFWVFDVPAGEHRAFHAHREQQEFIIAVRGSFAVRVEDAGVREECLLDAPDRGLLVPELVWVELSDFSPDAICLAFASGPYDEADNIRDYREYRRLTADVTANRSSRPKTP